MEKIARLFVVFVLIFLFSSCDNAAIDDGNGDSGGSENTQPPVVESDFGFEAIEGEVGKARITRYSGDSVSVTVPSTVSLDGVEYSVTEIGSNVFAYKDNIVEIILPDTVETMGESAFRGCESLNSFKSPLSLASIGSNCFYGCSSLLSFTLPPNVNAIGEDAFKGCDRLYEIDNQSELEITNDSNSLGGIGAHAISIIDSSRENAQPSRLKKEGKIIYYIEDDGSLTAISADKDVSKLENFDSKCTFIKEEAFTGLRGLKSVDMTGSSVKKIGSKAFADCIFLENVIVSDSVEEIGKDFLRGCGGLKSLTVPFIGKYANPDGKADKAERFKYPLGYFFSESDFYLAYDVEQFKPVFDADINVWTYPVATYYIPYFLEDVTVTNMADMDDVSSVQTGPHGYFENCDMIRKVVISGPTTVIGEKCFGNCKELKNISLPSQLTQIDQTAFEGCRFETVSYSRNGEGYGKYEFKDGKLTISEMPAVDNVSAWYSAGLNPLVLSVEIQVSGNIRSITKNCFKNCSSLKSMPVFDSLETIGDSAFEGCLSLSEFVFSTNLDYIGKKAFAYCVSLKSVTITSSGLLSIDDGAFGGCISLVEITLPFVGDSKILPGSDCGYHFACIFGKYEFKDFKYGLLSYGSRETNQSNQGTDGMTTYYVPESLRKVTILGGDIGYGAFSGCDRIKQIVLGDNVTSIGDMAFMGCTWLDTVKLPGNLASLGAQQIFTGCNSLDYMVLPASCKTISSGIFISSWGSYPIYLEANDLADISGFAEGWNKKDESSNHEYYFYSENEPTPTQKQSGKKYWHYDGTEENKITVWE